MILNDLNVGVTAHAEDARKNGRPDYKLLDLEKSIILIKIKILTFEQPRNFLMTTVSGICNKT